MNFKEPLPSGGGFFVWLTIPLKRKQYCVAPFASAKFWIQMQLKNRVGL